MLPAVINTYKIYIQLHISISLLKNLSACIVWNRGVHAVIISVRGQTEQFHRKTQVSVYENCNIIYANIIYAENTSLTTMQYIYIYLLHTYITYYTYIRRRMENEITTHDLMIHWDWPNDWLNVNQSLRQVLWQSFRSYFDFINHFHSQTHHQVQVLWKSIWLNQITLNTPLHSKRNSKISLGIVVGWI